MTEKKTAGGDKKTVRVTQVASAAGRYRRSAPDPDRARPEQDAIATRELEDTSAVRGMINKVRHLVRVD